MELTDTQMDAIRGFLANPTFLWGMGLSALVFAFAACRIFARAGLNTALGLLMLVPGVNVVMMLVLAFGRWPLENQVRELRKVQKTAKQAHDTLSKAA